ncbi:YetF domain-containing protein, partial [Bacillus thuringiensis]
ECKLPIELIMDGEIMTENLRQNNQTELELQCELKKRNLSYKDVTYAVLAANGNIYIDIYKDNITSPMDQE